MAFNPVDYYYLASWLYGQREELNFGESPVRAVVSKAYYGAFLEARNKAGITSKSPNVHQQVIDYYNQKNNSALANRLDSMRSNRNNADYDTSLTFTSREAGIALSHAKRVLDNL